MKNKVTVHLRMGLCLAFLAILFLGYSHAPQAQAKKIVVDDITYRITSKEATVLSAAVEGDRITIPSKVSENYPVTSIGYGAFSNTKYKTIQLPDSIQYIGAYAFYNNDAITTVKLPKKVKKIGPSAFARCGKLSNITIPDSVTSLGKGAFYECIALKEVSLPKNFQHINSYTFYNCYRMKKIKIPASVSYIDEKAFYRCTNIRTITIPKKMIEIEKHAFGRMELLQTVTFKGKKVRMGEYVFSGCSALKKVKLPSDTRQIPEGTFSNCGQLKTIKLPKNLSIIKAYAFYGTHHLKKVTLNHKLYAIGDRAFAESGLKSIRMNSNMQYIGNGAFQSTKLRHIRLSGKVTYIGNRVFANCRKLKSISIPASVKGINPGAFNNCYSLYAINVAGSNSKYASSSGVLYNKGMTKLIQYPLAKKSASYSVPGSVHEIRAHAFEGNSHLRSISTSAHTIGDYAFSYMSKLTTARLGSGVTKVGYGAFRYSGHLKSLSVADSVQVLEPYCFAGSSITSFHIPSSLSKFSPNVISGCRKIRSFDGGSSKFKSRDGILFNGSMTTLILYPPKKTTSTYNVPSSVKTIGSYGFNHVKALRKITFEKSIKKMAGGCIYDCPKLKSVEFASGTRLKSGYYAISYCPSLAVIVGPPSSILHSMARSAGATFISL